jgi:putative flippase GtrA
LIKQLTNHIPPGQLFRYLAVGVWNTLFGYGCFFAFTKLFLHLVPGHPSLMASAAVVASTFVNITVSFFGYKLFVFRSRGNALHEYLRSFIVYLPTMAIGALAIAPLTLLFEHVARIRPWAPYIAGAALQAVTVIVSFLGHKRITFRQKDVPGDVPATETQALPGK